MNEEMIAKKIQKEVCIPEVAVKNVMAWGSAGCEQRIADGKAKMEAMVAAGNWTESNKIHYEEQKAAIEKAAEILKKYGR